MCKEAAERRVIDLYDKENKKKIMCIIGLWVLL